MKTLKYGSVFKKVAGGSAQIAIETGRGFSLRATIGHQLLGLQYTGPNNRAFLRDLRMDKNWQVGEIDVVDFDAALRSAYAVNGQDLNRLDVETLHEAVGYTGKVVDPKHPNTLLSMIWLHDGLLYGTNGHSMHRVKGAMPVYDKAFAFSPTMLNAFLSLVLFDKKSAWIGAVRVHEDMVRLIGGNDSVTCWLDTGQLEGETTYESMLEFFRQAVESVDQRAKEGVFLLDQRKGALRDALKNAPLIGNDANVVGLCVYPDRILFMDDKHLPDEEFPPVLDVLVAPGEYYLEANRPIKIVVNHKYLMNAMDVPGKTAVLTMGGADYLWLGDALHTAIVMPMNWWKENSNEGLTVREQAERAAEAAEFEAAT